MVFSKPLLEGIRRGRIKCSIRFWTRSHVKVDGRYPLGDGQIVVDSITPIGMSQITEDLAGESGFGSVQDLLDVARHGIGENIYLIRFHYLRPGGWDERPAVSGAVEPAARPLLQRIRTSRPAASRRKPAGGPGPRGDR
jgi:hypothetical protein